MGQMADDERRQKMRELRRTMEARRVVVRVQENLRTLRREKGIGPKEMAFLRAKRPRLSPLEEKADMELSTLASLVTALGGTLEITVRFPDRKDMRLV